MSENWIQAMNRCTGPSLCTCPMGPHQPDNPECYRNVEAKREERRDAFDAKVRTHGYVDRATGERIHDSEQLGNAGVPVVVAANPSLDQGPCTVCGKLWRDHGTYPVYESHNYTPASGVKTPDGGQRNG